MKRLRLALLGAVVAALVVVSSAAAFTPSNAYYAKQWYLGQDGAFDAWDSPPPFAPVKVAVVDSGVDCSLPDFAGQLAAEKSFVGGSPCIDTEGHGTIVAGEIAGALDQAGVVGLAYKSQLLVAKVVDSGGTIPLKAEAAGIRWAVNHGAQVVNLSFGAVRDPRAPNLDSYSKIEARAVAYAVQKGAVVVAAVGNADEAYTTPWPYASWPAALPHVIGVGALTKAGKVPDFSDQDPVFVDMAAPGVGIFSTFPKDMGASRVARHRATPVAQAATTSRPKAPRSRRRRCRRPRRSFSASTRRSRTARSRGSSSGTPTTSTPRPAAASVPSDATSTAAGAAST